MKRVKFRDAVSEKLIDRLVYANEFLSQPDPTLAIRKPNISLKNERPLPMLDEEDILLVQGKIDRSYHSWIRSFGLGTDNVFEFNAPVGEKLTDLILQNSKKVKSYLGQFDGSKILIPVYSGQADINAADSLGIDILGNQGKITDLIYDKWSFKQKCKSLNLNVPKGCLLETRTNDYLPLMKDFISKNGSSIVKTLSSASGNLIYVINQDNVEQIAKDIFSKGQFVMEEKKNIQADMNDQWLISPEGNIYFIGVSYQEIGGGVAHKGNNYPVKGVPLDDRIPDMIKLVSNLRDKGYVGVNGLDVIYNEDEGFIFIENNSRMNGSTYSRGIVDKLENYLPISNWISRPLRTNKVNSFNGLKELTSDLIFNGSESEAVFFPYDVSLIHLNQTFIGLFAGNSKESVEKIYNSVNERLL